jgi:hypothetical protein
MYDDYDLDYTIGNDYLDEDTYHEHHSRLDTHNLDESTHNLDENAYDLDEYYARDAHDLEALAYLHYA